MRINPRPALRPIAGGSLLAVMLVAFCSISAHAAALTLSTADYMAIQQLYARFNTALDTGQAEQFADTWTEDGEFVGGRGAGRGSEVRTPIKGRAALLAMGREHQRTISRHFISNLIITPTADGAKASCYLVLYSARSSPPTVAETAITEDTLVRTPQGWKFRKRITWRDDDDISPYRPKSLTQAPSTQPPS